ncbi:hypothetical protein FSDG_00758 [Fusobacterium animalis 7_1]|uniref:Uncharacterized protein n=2 Tax=Fusobacterium animalis TaxID=76859 RepID=A0A140PPZ6_9FUSO|nr:MULTISPECIES: hypothetical protein [Fusobacterium]AKC57518.1 hypothetical protein HMPREF1993_00025 [Fusobacterium phage Funu1]EEO42199.1 hypothetical protein FSDG_00758 [Fusobacterium animalis 7_1]EGN67146.1 hypothetical protein HMPREF0401_01162 [Fusobacterium animalis 11_3_2]EHG20154.2 hypothetical protein HMPREF9369_00222 [Fusobacterium polymorphum F0401]
MNKVIKIIDAYNILISRDEDFKNIKINSILEIYSEGPEISYENKSYGTLDLVKAELRVKEVFPRMLLCENNKYTKVKVSIPSALRETQTFPTKKLKNIFSQAQNSYLFGLDDIYQKDKIQEVEKIVPLKIDEAQIDKTINLNESLTIKLGDPVRLKEDYK